MNVRENRIARHRREREEQQRYLAELELLAQRLRSDGGLLRGEIERAVATGNPATAHPLLQRHGKLARSLAAIEGQIAAAGAALAAAARELKRHELANFRNTGAADARRPPRSSQALPAFPDRRT